MKNRRPLEEVSVPLNAQWTWTSSFFSPMHGLLPSVLWLLPEGYAWARNNRCLTRGLPTCWGSWLTGVAFWKDRGLAERKNNWVVRLREVEWGAGIWQTRRMGLWSEEMVRQKLRCVSCSGEQEFRVCLCRGVHQAFQSPGSKRFWTNFPLPDFHFSWPFPSLFLFLLW